MRMFLVSCVILFCVVVISALIKAKSPNRQATRKHNKKLKPQQEPSSLLNDVKLNAQEELTEEEIDADEALGLKESQPEKLHREAGVTEEAAAPQYLVLHVMAPAEKQFSGYELLQALLSNGMRYGKQKIFHYHASKHGQGGVLFSLASINKPGTFDLPNMSHFSCPGLTFFMVLTEQTHPQEAFEKMLTVAKHIAEDLQGDVCYEDYSVLTFDKVKMLRERVTSFVNSIQTEDLFS